MNLFKGTMKGTGVMLRHVDIPLLEQNEQCA